jgi:hypothetical protein
MIIGNGITIGSNITIGDLPVVVYTPSSALYTFTTMTFTTAGNVGRYGPNLANCVTTYSGSSYTGNTWVTNTSYFNMTTQGYQLWTVPATGTYSITAAGSRAGRATGQNYTSGNGAIVSGTVALTQGQVLEIICGQCLDASSGNASVTSYAGLGGGGGTFVNNFTASTLLFAAGGGSGASIYSSTTPTGYNGANGQTTTWGGNGTVTGSNVGGLNGNGGKVYTTVASSYRGGAGAGWLSNGQNGDATTPPTYPSAVTYGNGGLSYANGFIGGSYGTSWGNPSTYASTYGGFGGAGGGNGIITGGAGGGYSGGGQSGTNTYNGQPGGGGSYITASATGVATSDGNYNLISTFNGGAITNLSAFNQGLGYVIITRVS